MADKLQLDRESWRRVPDEHKKVLDGQPYAEVLNGEWVRVELVDGNGKVLRNPVKEDDNG